MTTIGVAETLIKANNIKNTNDRVRFLQQNKNNRTMLILLQMAFSPNIKFALPDGPTPYTPLPPEFPDNEGRLYGETRRLYLFVEGGFAGKVNNALKQDRREVLWVQLLESMDANDAALLDAVKDGKTPYKGITAVVVRKAFPGLLPATVKKVTTSEETPGPGRPQDANVEKPKKGPAAKIASVDLPNSFSEEEAAKVVAKIINKRKRAPRKKKAVD